MADQQIIREEQQPCHPRRHHRKGSRIMDKIITSITCIPKRSRKKRKKHDAEQPLPPVPNNMQARQDMHAHNASDARDNDEEEISDSCLSDMTMSPFSDLYSRTISVTDSAESTSSRSLSSINKTKPYSTSRAYAKTPEESMSEATTESEGESEISSSYYVPSSSPLLPLNDLGQPKNGTLRQIGSVLAAVSLVASLVRLMMYGETCALLLTSSVAFLVITWCPMAKRLVPNKRNNGGNRSAYVKLNYKG